MTTRVSALISVVLLLPVCHGVPTGGHVKVEYCALNVDAGSSQPASSFVDHPSRLCAPNEVPSTPEGESKSVVAAIQCCRRRSIESIDAIAGFSNTSSSFVQCTNSLLDGRPIIIHDARGNYWSWLRSWSDVARDWLSPFGSTHECFPQATTHVEAEVFCAALNEQDDENSLIGATHGEGVWRLCSVGELEGGACCGNHGKSCPGNDNTRTTREVWTSNACSVTQINEKYKVEMVWLGAANWILKFFSGDGERHTALFNTALQTRVGQGEFLDQLHDIMATVGATSIDYIFITGANDEHSRGVSEYAERFGSRVYAPKSVCDGISSHLATCTTTQFGQRFETDDGLLVEIGPPLLTNHEQGAAGSTFRISFPGSGSSVFLGDLSATFGLNSSAELEIFQHFLDELRANIDSSGVNLWLIHGSEQNLEAFDDINGVINARNVMVRDVLAEDYYSDLTLDIRERESGGWMERELNSEKHPPELLSTGNYFTTVWLYGPEAVVVESDYHEVFKSLRS